MAADGGANVWGKGGCELLQRRVKKVPGRGNIMCKDPKANGLVACLRIFKYLSSSVA